MNIERIGLDPNLRKVVGQSSTVAPVGGGPASVEQARIGQQEGAGADGAQAPEVRCHPRQSFAPALLLALDEDAVPPGDEQGGQVAAVAASIGGLVEFALPLFPVKIRQQSQTAVGDQFARTSADQT